MPRFRPPMNEVKKSPGNRCFETANVWRFPAVLSGIALAFLPFPLVIPEFERGSTIRSVLANLSAVGACSCILALGLGLWIGLRTRKWKAILTGFASMAVAILWWLLVFRPLIEGG